MNGNATGMIAAAGLSGLDGWIGPQGSSWSSGSSVDLIRRVFACGLNWGDPTKATRTGGKFGERLFVIGKLKESEGMQMGMGRDPAGAATPGTMQRTTTRPRR